MRPTAQRAIAASALVLLGTGIASSCSTRPRAADERPPERADAESVHERITQHGFGQRARFATCLPSSCPTATPKTFPSGAAAAASAVGPEGIGSSLRIRKILISGSDHELQTPLQPPSAVGHAGPTLVASTVTLQFAFGSAALTPAALASIDEAVPASGIERLVIRGRTDSVGPAAVNETLARARAEAVLQYLRTHHSRLAAIPLTLDAQGACCYAASNGSLDGQARNRRVELVFERVTGDP